MPLPAIDTASRRNLLLGGLLALLLVVPTALGFAVANAGESRPPTAAEEASATTTPRTGISDIDQSELISDAPLANAPSTAADALTRTGEEALGLARITFDSDATGRLRVDNGGTVPLAGGYEVKVAISPYPPDRFDLFVHIELLRDGVPVTDATIDTVWDMTLMGHGPFETRLTPIGGGAYETNYAFFMFGPWAVDATATMPGVDPLEFRLSFYIWPA
jgi:hypothetical protein